MARQAAFSLLLLTSASGNFVPFADVEELKPAKVDPYCSKQVDKDGHRWCERSIVKRLEDGGDVVMNWKMHVNPDNILSLDTEAEHGVKVLKCFPGGLEVELPNTHHKHAVAGKFIVGSHFVHGCGHLTKQHMYHKIKEVRGKYLPMEQSGKHARFELATEALPNAAHAYKHLSYNFSYMPVEARDHSPFPKMRTQFGQEKLKGTEEGRRLGFLGDMFKNSQNSQFNSGNLQSQGSSSGGINTQNGVVNLSPKQVSNFGWNWNFYMNDTNAPHYTIDKPGTKGSIILKHPYVKAHAGCFINFTSEFEGIMAAPHVQWRAGYDGVGRMQGRLEAAMNSTADAYMDPEHYKLSAEFLDSFPILHLLKEFDQPRWFSSIQHSVGHLPMQIEPGFQFQASLYHHGPFSGFLSFGGSTRGRMKPILHFDSKKGFWSTCETELHDTDVWPPMWMVFTKKFEMGIQGRPTMLLRGDFMGFKGAEAAIDVRPYLNVTVAQPGETDFAADEKKTLTIYPLRVMGLNHFKFDRRFKVKISVDGKDMSTSAEMNWGQIQYNNPLKTFATGPFASMALRGKTLKVSLWQTDVDGNAEVNQGAGTFKIQSVNSDGTVEPSPSFVTMKNANNQDVAVVQLFMLHSNRASEYFAGKIFGVGLSATSIKLSDADKSTIKANFPNVNIQQDPVSLHITEGARTYISQTKGTVGAVGTSDLKGTAKILLPPNFGENWATCSMSLMCNDPRLALFVGSTKVGEAEMPQFHSVGPNAGDGGFLANILAPKHNPTGPTLEPKMTRDVKVTLDVPNKPNAAVATVTIQASVTNPTQSSYFVTPKFGSNVQIGSKVLYSWIVEDAVETTDYFFRLTPMKIVAKSQVLGQDLSKYRRIDDDVLIPLARSVHLQDIPLKCTKKPVGNMSAEQSPCVFSHMLEIQSGAYSPGEQFVLLTQWQGTSGDGLTRTMYAPPVKVGTGGGRRLSEDEGALPFARQLGFDLFNPSTWTVNSSIDDNDPKCARQDLRFNIGEGVLVRGEIRSMGIPAGMPGFPAPDPNLQAPLFSTPWSQMGGGTKPGTSTQDFLPKELCDAGLCDSVMPGCRQAKFKKLHFPILKFRPNRTYFYDDVTKTGEQKGMANSKFIQEGMAWAFSCMPEALTVVLKQMKDQQRAKQLAQQANSPVYPWTVTQPPQQGYQNGYQHQQGYQNGYQNGYQQQQGFGQQQQFQQPTQAPQNHLPPQLNNMKNQMANMFKNSFFGGNNPTQQSQVPQQTQQQTGGAHNADWHKWWNNQRRLSAVQEEKHPFELDQKDDEVVVKFHGGLPYKVTDELVQRMIKFGYFKNLLPEKHSDIHITEFWLDEGHTETIELDENGNEIRPQQGISVIVAAAAVFCTMAVALAIVVRSKRSNGYEEAIPMMSEGGLE
eukprot:TRINITY_DN2167_c0_g1_i1.p1 TRINITY_DN2167_c0_g1~~TRINITY_DN2167_c0_g1_i1.p1  ORF type:complete len:1398 (+),score=305.30 TRINITY_DN2167_c0_g1_i1:119-4312(+)